MEYIVDMQGFKQGENEYVLKELAIVPLFETCEPLHVLVKQPFSWRKLTEKCKEENIWLQHNYHGIRWKSSGIEYCQIGKILREALHDATKVYVQNQLKAEWLKRFKFPVCNISTLEFSSKPKCVTVCLFHNGKAGAMHNVKIMKLLLLSR